jgi:UDP-galactopyranose mutase
MDFLIVGAGFFGTTVAERLAEAGLNVRVIDRRPHVGGNCYSRLDPDTGIECHEYGSHIFHTSEEAVWDYLTRFTTFNQYRHTVWTTYKDRVYSMPINLATINSYYGLNLKPGEVKEFIVGEIAKEKVCDPSNLEEKAISLIGRPLYEAFIRGYTIKQWEKDPRELPPDIITRLPVRHNYSNGYFADKYEGIPLDGYTRIFERMLDHPRIEVCLSTDYFDCRNEWDGIPTLYTGPVDRFFDFRHGYLDWRTIDFTREIHPVPDYQGCTVMNYADEQVPFTRIHEFKHFHPERPATENTVTFTEFSRVAGRVDEPYYPVNTPGNSRLLAMYQQEMSGLKNIWFGGRLGFYKYFDMDDTVGAALVCAEKIKKELSRI